MGIYRAPVAHVKSGSLSKRNGLLAVVMRYYPRYLKKELVDEYVRALAPDERLFSEFKAKEREIGDHNAAFAAVAYEERFTLGAEGMGALERLAMLAKTRDVYLVCQCDFEKRCHCDLLLMTARERFGALVAPLPFEYPLFAARLSRD